MTPMAMQMMAVRIDFDKSSLEPGRPVTQVWLVKVRPPLFVAYHLQQAHKWQNNVTIINSTKSKIN